MKIVILAEKPSQAKAYADSFKSKQKIEGGFLIKDALFEDEVAITYGYGHLVELQAPESYKPEWKKWSLNELPMFPESYQFKVAKDKRAQFRIVKRLLDEADEIIVATDSDREGENIARSIIKVSGNEHKPTKRLWINSLENDEIRKGFESLRPGEDYFSSYIEAQTRQISDWLIGMNISRLYTLLLQQKGLSGVFSIGRVQTPTLYLIWQRQQEIENFEPQTYFEAYIHVNAAQGTYVGKYKDTFKTLPELIDFFKGFDVIHQQEQAARIAKVETKEKKEYAPRLYSLSDIQSQANKLYKVSPATTLKIVQTLYEKKLVSYPRTDCHYITPAEYAYLKKNIEGYCERAGVEIKDPQNYATKRHVDASKVQEHYAIIPTKKIPTAAALAKLGPMEQRLYHLILRRTLAIFAQPYIYDETIILTDVNTQIFKTTGRMIRQLGWKEIIGAAKKKTDEEKLPIVELNEVVQSRLYEKEAETKAPPAYTEGTLITAMKNIGRTAEDEAKAILKAIEGIGTEATRASILETLKRQDYIEVTANQLQVTAKGSILCEAIVGVEISSAEMTAKWESYFKKIHDKTGTQEAFLGSIQRFIQHLIATVPEQIGTEKIAIPMTEEPLGICPSCGASVLEKFKVYGCEKCDFVIYKKILNKKISRPMCSKLLKSRRTALIKGFLSKKGKKFNAVLILDDANKVAFEFIPFKPKVKKS